MPERNMLTFTDRELIDYKYIEKMVLPQWQIISEEKEILGYKCQQAQTELYGRKWTVWFAPDIPISDGPWKFHGLPGLILEAVDSNNYFHFTCIGIEKMDTSNRMISIPKKKYVKCTRKELIQAKRENRKDVIAYTYKVWGIKSKMYDANGRDTKPTSQELFYIEDDIK